MICKFNYIFILKNLYKIVTQRKNAYVCIKKFKIHIKGIVSIEN